MNNKSLASNKYNKENTIQILIRLNKNTDNDIIEVLNRLASKQGYIKDLIRCDIEKDDLYNDWVKMY